MLMQYIQHIIISIYNQYIKVLHKSVKVFYTLVYGSESWNPVCILPISIQNSPILRAQYPRVTRGCCVRQWDTRQKQGLVVAKISSKFIQWLSHKQIIIFSCVKYHHFPGWIFMENRIMRSVWEQNAYHVFRLLFVSLFLYLVCLAQNISPTCCLQALRYDPYCSLWMWGWHRPAGWECVSAVLPWH